jgi:hypothetical protein
MEQPMSRTGWGALLEWAVAFGLLALTVIGAASIGMFVAPFAIVATIASVRRNRDWPEAPLGGLIGVGAVCLFIAYRGRHEYPPCPPPGTKIRVARGQHFACEGGGPDPLLWLLIGLALAGAGLVGYLLVRRRHRGAARQEHTRPETR